MAPVFEVGRAGPATAGPAVVRPRWYLGSMEPFLVVLAVVGGLALFSGGLAMVPFGTWEFAWRGRQIRVRNYLLSETITVDGQPVATRREGNLMWCEHELELDGDRLRIWVSSNGDTVSCRADDGTRVIFQSKELPPPLDLPAPKPALEAEDRRLAAARVLLGAVAEVDRAAAADLERALVQVLADESAAREAAEAHVALGGTAAEAGAVLEHRSRAVEELMATLRQLHLRVSGPQDAGDPAPALREAREALSRLDAAREVDAAARAASLRRAQRTSG